jgi:N-terminal TM domain of oligopeptide transport permease C
MRRTGVAAGSPLRLVLDRLRRDRVAMASAAVILLLVVVALAAPLIAHLVGHDPDTQYRDTGLVFGLPGLGQLAVQSVTTQDLPVIVVDLLYAVLDPQVRRT